MGAGRLRFNQGSANGPGHPPTAQHALREGKIVGRNIAAAVRGKTKTPFEFKIIDQLAAIGRRTGVAKVFGIKFSGFIAWWLWRTIYLSKLPRLEKKVRVALDWTLDVIFSKDIVQFMPRTAAGQSNTQDKGTARDVQPWVGSGEAHAQTAAPIGSRAASNRVTRTTNIFRLTKASSKTGVEK